MTRGGTPDLTQVSPGAPWPLWGGETVEEEGERERRDLGGGD